MTRRTPADAVTLPDVAPVAEVATILRHRLVTPVFQPIVDLATGAVVAAEALARGPAGTRLERPDELFAAANEAGQLGPVDMLCAERALECALGTADPPPMLFINAEPAVLDQPLSPRMLELLLSGPPFRIVLEYTERALSTVPGALLRIAGHAHRLGNAIALDDVGADPMSLAFLPFIEPDVIKLDMHLLRRPSAPATAQVAAVVAATARRTGATVIAEGIETAADIDVALRLGATWGQGWHFGRPGPITALGRAPVGRTPAVRAARPGLHQPVGSPFEVAVATRGSAGLAGDATVGAALERISAAVGGQEHAVVLGSYCVPGDVEQWLPRIERVTRQAVYTAVLGPDCGRQPFPGESSLVVSTPGYAAALCRRPGAGVLFTEDHETVAAVGRVLLQRL
ncbi:EAL domain-containing protein [Actinoplanes sp. Pm04-4]|uniref:EAL domain-containing protein n=1 Tax=Paractinoplanes pyxinae TaxID=2997416 RepID=A0ABT4BCN5_9ACTN|nr:EAL domain-containing protein [Actinoplanes pyxinae]MCY1143757.1 EAL domain-containing protein [Actinoplanes pyxinae]